jgi:hypothetical protein
VQFVAERGNVQFDLRVTELALHLLEDDALVFSGA